MRSRVLIALFVLGLLLVSAVAVVYAKYQSRKLFAQANRQVQEIDQLNIEWQRLLLEHATWGAPNRIEREARRRLHMRLPRADEVIVIRGKNGA